MFSRQSFQAISAVLKTYGVSIQLACECLCISDTCYAMKRSQMLRISESRIGCFGWLRRIANGVCVILPLQSLKGFIWNHKSVYCIYPELELNPRIKPKKRIVRERPVPLSVPTAVNQV